MRLMHLRGALLTGFLFALSVGGPGCGCNNKPVSGDAGQPGGDGGGAARVGVGAQLHAAARDQLLGDGAFLRKVNVNDLADDRFGAPTVRDILAELEKPGRDPRPEFKAATFRDDVRELSDLKPGMLLEGVVTNVTAFGAFVDVGVHQDGLVHISRLAKRYVKDPREVVKAGDLVQTKVLEVDLPRKRIALTLRLDDPIEDVARGGRPTRDTVRNR